MLNQVKQNKSDLFHLKGVLEETSFSRKTCSFRYLEYPRINLMHLFIEGIENSRYWVLVLHTMKSKNKVALPDYLYSGQLYSGHSLPFVEYYVLSSYK